LAKRSHNRRRWSHVFPAGEIEFKRHAGPIWKSLISPAILPLSVDYFPSRQEIDQFFQFNIYNVTLSDFENTPYSTHADLLMEMVRQRLSQDYQLVPPSCVDETIRRPKPMIGHGRFLAFCFLHNHLLASHGFCLLQRLSGLPAPQALSPTCRQKITKTFRQ